MKQRFDNSQAQLFKIKTQIRAQFNKLRSIYNIFRYQNQPLHKKLFPDRQNQCTSILPFELTENRSHSRKRHCGTPVHMSSSHINRKRHCSHVEDTLEITFKPKRKPCAYLKKPVSPQPEKLSKSQSTTLQQHSPLPSKKEACPFRFSKRIHPSQHVYNKNLL